MSRGLDQFWFIAGDGTFRMYDLDGGVKAPLDRTPGEVWIDVVLER